VTVLPWSHYPLSLFHIDRLLQTGAYAGVLAREATEISQLIGFWSYVLPRLLPQRGRAVPQAYRAFSIGPEWLAIGVRELDVLDDEDALKKASPIFSDGLKRVEVWCGSRKVGDIPPKVDDISDDDAIRDSA
jgi:hypothetical protein